MKAVEKSAQSEIWGRYFLVIAVGRRIRLITRVSFAVKAGRHIRPPQRPHSLLLLPVFFPVRSDGLRCIPLHVFSRCRTFRVRSAVGEPRSGRLRVDRHQYHLRRTAITCGRLNESIGGNYLLQRQRTSFHFRIDAEIALCCDGGENMRKQRERTMVRYLARVAQSGNYRAPDEAERAP